MVGGTRPVYQKGARVCNGRAFPLEYAAMKRFPAAAALAAFALAGCSRPAAAPPPPSATSPPHMTATAPTEEAAEPAPPPPKAKPSFFLAEGECAALFSEGVAHGLPPGGLLLVVDVARQRALLASRRGPLREFPVSTSAVGTGSAPGSNRTPLGWHRAAERFGAGAAPGTMFVSRRPNGRVLPESQWSAPDPAEDAVLTRVVWLEGLEPGVNRGPGADSRERCIYLHGTNQEQKLGTPASHGCIRFSNADIVRLFDFADGAELYVLVR